MTIDDPIRLLVLEEFRLHAADVDGAAARIVAATARGIEPAIPLLTSIEDSRDVATLRGLHAGEPTATDAAQHAALDALVETWEAPKHYGPRIAERSVSPSASFRLAVTESGINAAGGEPDPDGPRPNGSTKQAVGLLWIGTPVGSHAGLLVLLGSFGAAKAVDRDPARWPLPLSHSLGVRIYESAA